MTGTPGQEALYPNDQGLCCRSSYSSSTIYEFMTLCKLFNLAQFQFSYLKNENDDDGDYNDDNDDDDDQMISAWHVSSQ